MKTQTSFLACLIISLFLSSCLKSEKSEVSVEDQHETFVSLVNEKTANITQLHGACIEWNKELQKQFITTPPETILRERGQIFELVEKDPQKILAIIKGFDDTVITRYLEYELYRLPLDFPRSDRNLQHYLETTKNMPECHSLFDEYGLMHGIVFATVDHPKLLKVEGEKLVLEYLFKSLENEHYPFINLLTNAALMRTLAMVGVLPKDAADAFGTLLMQIEGEQQRFMESVGKTLKSEGVPTLAEYRAILALNEDREEKAKFYQTRLLEFLQEQIKK